VVFERVEKPTFPIAPYPSGWFQIAYSDEVGAGDVVPLKYFGTDLVCYRDEGGALHLVDAFCPHLGAHLGYGGRVEAETIICPFHGWQWGPDGRNVNIPYATRVNTKARLRTWVVREINGLAMAWYQPDGKPPEWELEPVPELTDPEFARVARTSFDITVHPQEVFENAVDLAHFLSVHQAARMPDVELKVDGPHFRSITTNQALKRGTGYFEGAVESELWGLGVDVARVTGVVDTVAVLTLTPIDGVKVHARFGVTARVSGDDGAADPERGARLADKAQRRVIEEFKTDLVIWEHKRYQPSPNLAPSEKLITTYRKWAQQFYT
jgi:nitrite reductase/ring-hydroxylating ferredoxin subunit